MTTKSNSDFMTEKNKIEKAVELLPCPFCGTAPAVSTTTSASGEKLVYCNNGECAIWGDKCFASRWNNQLAAKRSQELEKENEALTMSVQQWQDVAGQLRIAYKDALKASNNFLEVMKQWPQGTKAYAEAFRWWYEVTTSPLAIETLKK